MADGRHFENRYIAISSDFDEIVYTAADPELDVRHVIKNEKVALDRLRVRHERISCYYYYYYYYYLGSREIFEKMIHK